ncbi:MAG: hypothetical protein ACT4P7_15135 [Gemmatimonadaceae bacterium]
MLQQSDGECDPYRDSNVAGRRNFFELAVSQGTVTLEMSLSELESDTAQIERIRSDQHLRGLSDADRYYLALFTAIQSARTEAERQKLRDFQTKFAAWDARMSRQFGVEHSSRGFDCRGGASRVLPSPVTFELVGAIVNPTLPLPDGDRVVQIRNWDVKANDAELCAPNDFLLWRGALLRPADGGRTDLHAPREETCFAHRFAMLRDRFGTSWMLRHERPPAEHLTEDEGH